MKHLIEEDLMEKYHWTPEQINKLSYKWLQRHYLIDKVKREAMENKVNLRNYHAENQSKTSSGRGQIKRTMISGVQNVVSSNKNAPAMPKATRPAKSK